MFFDPVIKPEIVSLFQELSDSKANDSNFLSSNLMKSFKQELCEPLTIVFNELINAGIFPDILKISKITPIFKKGDKSDPNNYRPIAVLPFFSKIFEKIIYNRLIDFFTNFNVLNKNQHGFLKNKSTTTAIFEFVDKVLKGLDDKDNMLGLFIDLSKAFDCVDHDILLKNLSDYGVRGSGLNLMRSYLSNRTQFVAFNSEQGYTTSDPLPNNIGIPQGSCLGPLLFILYINDLVVLHDDVFVVKYADDTSFVVKDKNINNLIAATNQLLSEVNMYFKSKKLQLNADKTSLIGFQLQAANNNIFENLVVECDGVQIKFDEHTKLLGAIIDRNFKWQQHIDQICKKLSKLVYVLRNLSKVVTVDVLKAVYFAHFHSVLIYGIEIWGQAPEYLIKRVHKLQKQAIRIIANVPPDTSCKENNLYALTQILPVPALYVAQVLIFVNKYPQYFSESKFKHDYNTRNKDKFVLDTHKTVTYERGLFYSGKLLFNHLPNSIRAIKNCKTFKQLIKKFMFANNILSIKEFKSKCTLTDIM